MLCVCRMRRWPVPVLLFLFTFLYLAAVTIDGDTLFSAQSKSVDPDGWFSLGEAAGTNAPFDMPFYFIL